MIELGPHTVGALQTSAGAGGVVEGARMDRTQREEVRRFIEHPIDAGSWPQLWAEDGQRYCRALLGDLDQLQEACLAYDHAIRSCAGDPSRMASFCSAEGDDLDALYFRMMELAGGSTDPLP